MARRVWEVVPVTRKHSCSKPPVRRENTNRLDSIPSTLRGEKGDGLKYILVINDRLPSLNDYVNSSRANRNYGNIIMRSAKEIVDIAILQYLRGVRIDNPVYMRYAWYEPNKKRDLDNISSMGRKIIQDALVDRMVLQNDGWNEIQGFSDTFHIDRDNPRVEVVIEVIV